MEDLTYGYNKPCVMDVKMGSCTVGDDANIFKELYMVNKDKNTTSFELGCRIVAYRVWLFSLSIHLNILSLTILDV